MDYYRIDLICIAIHVVTILMIVKRWKGQSILHPGLYFSILWLISTISQWIASSYDVMPTPNEPAIVELNILAAYTSIVFLLLSDIGRRKHKIVNTLYLADGKCKFLKAIILIALLSTIITFFSIGASLNFSANRVGVINYQSHIRSSYSFLESILAICNTTLPFASILIGYYLGMQFATNEKRIGVVWVCLPLVIGFLTSMMQGGRISVLNSIKNYLIGIGFALSVYSIPRKKSFKILLCFVILTFAFLSFITIIGESRAELTGYDYKFSKFGMFAGVIDYMCSHYWGFQLRRMDYANGVNLYYGVNTFYGFLDFRIPFSSVFGLKGNMWNALGVNFDPLSIYKSGVKGCYTTSSQFMPLIADFGTKGVYFAIIILVYLTQKIFLSVINKPKKSACSLVLYYMFFCYWFGSNFNGGFMSLYTILLAAILFDIIRKVFKEKY